MDIGNAWQIAYSTEHTSFSVIFEKEEMHRSGGKMYNRKIHSETTFRKIEQKEYSQ